MSEGIVPLGEFKAQAAKLLKRLVESGEPIVVTQNGRPAGVFPSPKEFDRIQEKQRFLESVRDAMALYRGARRGHLAYVRFKVRMDPVYRLICERMGRVDSVVDLGTGLALLPVLLSVRGQAGEIVAVEWDEAKLACARLACSNRPNVTLHSADARSFPLPPADAVCLVDLLHYYSVEDQRALLERAAAALRPGGRLVIREACGFRGGRVRLARLFERLSVRFRWNRGPGLVYRECNDIVADLSGLGLECTLEGANSILHEGNTLVWALKRA